MFRVQTPFQTVARLLPVFVPGLAPARPATQNVPRLRLRACSVDGRICTYGEVIGRDDDGQPGPLVALVHGWGLAHTSYKRAAESLASHGYRVVLPDLPGFGWSSDLPLSKVSFPAFASHLRGFLERVQAPDAEPEPAHVIGHSFGGAVSLKLAHDAPELVRSLTLVNAATGATWSRNGDRERPLSDRPLWNWAVHLVGDFPVREFPSAGRPVLTDLRHNVLFHLPSLGAVANITRHSDQRQELATVSERGTPITVVWGSGDRVVTKACFEDQCAAARCDGTVVPGHHGWLFETPSEFGRVVAEFLRTT